MSERLKPCPKCGTNRCTVFSAYKQYEVHCENCGAQQTEWFETKEETVSAWNENEVELTYTETRTFLREEKK